MSEIVFKCPCLASGCGDNEIRKWYHSKCPSTSYYYLSDEGILRCNYCNGTWRITNLLWKSPSCSHDYRETDFQRLMKCIGMIYSEEYIPRNFIRKLVRNLDDMM